MRTEVFAKKWRLPRLSPVSFRHWVASALRRAGLSLPASAHWMGHDPTLSGAMRDVYDNPEDTFAEQSARLPDGPMALLEPVEVSVADGLLPEIVALVREYQAGNIGTMELATRIETLRVKSNASFSRTSLVFLIGAGSQAARPLGLRLIRSTNPHRRAPSLACEQRAVRANFPRTCCKAVVVPSHGWPPPTPRQPP